MKVIKVSKEEENYFCQQFQEFILINAPHYTDFQEGVLKIQMNLSEYEKGIYQEVIFNVYQKLKFDGYITDSDKIGIFQRLTEKGISESKRLNCLENKIEKEPYFTNSKLKIITENIITKGIGFALVEFLRKLF